MFGLVDDMEAGETPTLMKPEKQRSAVMISWMLY
jgi:hypothetical protein